MRYQANGFIPVNNPPARITKPCAGSISIVKGDVLHDNGSGYVTNATTTLDSATFLGVAAADCDNSAGSAGAKDVEIFPFDPRTKYSAPVYANAVISQTVVGSAINTSNNDDLAINVAVTTGLGFFVDDIDISAAAIAVNTYGYAIGHFALIVTES